MKTTDEPDKLMSVHGRFLLISKDFFRASHGLFTNFSVTAFFVDRIGVYIISLCGGGALEIKFNTSLL